MKLRSKIREIDFPRRPLLMGIVNVNDDSFCADGSLEPEILLEKIRAQIRAGADVIDIGAESARTNRAAINVEEEMRRFSLILSLRDQWLQGVQARDEEQIFPPIISANTWRTEVVEGVLKLGAEWINDMSALPNADHASLCSQHGAVLLIMHSVGLPKVPHFHQQWDDVMQSMRVFFTEKIALAESAGLQRDALILDPGIDFAKQCADNLHILNLLDEFHDFLCPLLIPVSRKTVIGEVLSLANPLERDAGTLALIASSMMRGAQIFRVHDVDACWRAVKTLNRMICHRA